MYSNRLLVYLSFFVSVSICRDFYAGMFKRNDLLVAQDRLFKEKIPYRVQFAKHARVFKCPITYMRVVDRLGYGRGPKIQIIRGGLKKKMVYFRISAYNSPISVNVYIGCANDLIKVTAATSTKSGVASSTTAAANETTTVAADGGNSTDDKPAGNDTSNATDSSTPPSNANDTSSPPSNGNDTTTDASNGTVTGSTTEAPTTKAAAPPP